MFDFHTFQLRKKDGTFVVDSRKSTTDIGGRKNFQSMATAIRYYSTWCSKESVEEVVKVHWAMKDVDSEPEPDEEIGYFITYYDEEERDTRVIRSWSNKCINTFRGHRDAGQVKDWKRVFSTKESANKAVAKLQKLYSKLAKNIRKDISDGNLRYYNKAKDRDIEREAKKRGHSRLDRARNWEIWGKIERDINEDRKIKALERLKKKADSFDSRKLEIKSLVLTHKESMNLDMLSNMM